MSSAKIVEVIYVQDLIGDGTTESPIQQRESLWSRQGNLIAWRTPLDSGGVGDVGFSQLAAQLGKE